MEKDDELKGIGNSYDFGARMLDPRVGRFLTLDPQSKNFPFESNYVYVSNNPIIYTDSTGEAKILTINLTDERTGKKYSISFVIDEDYIESRVSKLNNLLVASEYSWHDVNVIQDVTINKKGEYVFGNTTSKVLDRVITTTDATWIGKSETYARLKIDILQATTENDYPEESDSWSGGGIDFYSKNGEGSGVKAKDRSNLDYVNGDDMMTLAGMFKSFGKEGKGIPFPTSVKGKFSDAELQALKKIFEKSKKLATAIKEIATVESNLNKSYEPVKKGLKKMIKVFVVEEKNKKPYNVFQYYDQEKNGKYIRTDTVPKNNN